MGSVDREQALGLRLLISRAADDDWMRYRDMHELLDIIDSYIAQLGTPASVLPPEETDVILETKSDGWRQACVYDGEWSGYRGGVGGDYIAPEDALRWVPLPKENSDVK